MNTIKASEIKDIIPEEATHYIDDDGFKRFYIKHADKYLLIGRNGVKMPCDNIGNYFKESIAEIIYNTEFVPEVGMECEFNHPEFGWTGCEIVGPFRDRFVCAPNGGDFYAGRSIDFRPIKSEEDKLREAWFSGWTRQCLETSDDTLSAEYSIGTFIEFLIKAGVKLPEGEQ